MYVKVGNNFGHTISCSCGKEVSYVSEFAWVNIYEATKKTGLHLMHDEDFKPYWMCNGCLKKLKPLLVKLIDIFGERTTRRMNLSDVLDKIDEIRRKAG